MGQDKDRDAQTTRITVRYSQYSLHLFGILLDPLTVVQRRVKYN